MARVQVERNFYVHILGGWIALNSAADYGYLWSVLIAYILRLVAISYVKYVCVCLNMVIIVESVRFVHALVKRIMKKLIWCIFPYDR